MTFLNNYKSILKRSRIHNRSTVGVKFVKNSVNKKLLLYTFAHDSIKLWNVICSDEEFEIFEEKVIERSFCGVQSFDVSKNGKIITVVGVESTLHKFKLDSNYEVEVENYLGKFMEHWFVRISLDSNFIFTTSFSGSVKLLNIDGTQKLSSSLDKVKLITAIEYSNAGLLIAVANTQGWITILNSKTLTNVYTFEAHSCKVRCVQFSFDDTQILSGSDDKIIRLHTMKDSAATLEKNFCGHQGTIMTIVIDKSFKGERFASAALDNRIILWDINSGEKLYVFKNDTTDFPRSVAFSPDGRFIATVTDEAFLLVYQIPHSENYVEEETEELELTENVNLIVSPSIDHNGQKELYSKNNDNNKITTEEENSKHEFSTNLNHETTSLANDDINYNNNHEQNINFELENTLDSNGKQTENNELNEQMDETKKEESKNISEENLNEINVSDQEMENLPEDFERREIEMQLGID